MQDFQSLRAFVTVAREGSVSRAAERLHLTQPAVSLRLKQLGADVGLTLFRRQPHGLELTADGQALLPAAQKALAAIEAFNRNAQAMHATVRGRLRIGTIVDPEFIRLGAFLHHFVERAPQVETELHQGMSGTVLERVAQGELDVGFFLGPPGRGPWIRDYYPPTMPPEWPTASSPFSTIWCLPPQAGRDVSAKDTGRHSPPCPGW
ncbi:MAG: LysR family transcriptional regulator [Arhodomonas sp.]|nr:LysR family transcriptional regulator [Arhodomonas sp.]